MRNEADGEEGLRLKKVAIAMTVFLLLCCTAVGQSNQLLMQSVTFHVQGTVSDLVGFVAPGTEVTFQSNQVNRTVSVDEQGFYETDLPFGFYTMTARAPAHYRLLRKYERPLFRVMSPKSVVLNATLSSVGRSCDIRWNTSGPPEDPSQLENAVKDLCGGEDSFTVASNDGVPFQLHVRFPKRSSQEQSYVYRSDRVGRTQIPVFLEYNLFSLGADRVSYETSNRTIVASGNVVATDGSGVTRHANSLAFRIENGQAIPLN
jgi:hypothetical protein